MFALNSKSYDDDDNYISVSGFQKSFGGALGLSSIALISYLLNALLIDLKILQNSYFSYKLLANVINIT